MSATTLPSYYEILGVPPRASDDQIRIAYEHRVAHIEADSLSAAEGLRAQLLEAMEILTDPDLRQEYDRRYGPRAEPSVSNALRAAAERFDFEPALGDGAGEPVQLPLEGLLEGAQRGLVAARVPAVPVGGPPVIARISSELEEVQRRAEAEAIAKAEEALARVAERVRDTRPEPPKPKPIELGPDTTFSGELLRKIRESKGVTLQKLAEQTRISLRHLENIEADKYSELPVTVYLRGILMNLARELELDPLRVARSYLALVDDANKR